MNDDKTAWMWGIFDETGIFMALCRHGFVMLVVDMVRSREMWVLIGDLMNDDSDQHSKRAKYPLAVTNALLQAFGNRVGIGYDIRCKFGLTVSKSKLGPLADELNLRLLVGAFHGHAHQWLCQLSNLTTYTQGLGLEDLEGCEWFFSKSDALASSTRYATAFHRQQSIVEYFRHTDTFETYANLSKSVLLYSSTLPSMSN